MLIIYSNYDNLELQEIITTDLPGWLNEKQIVTGAGSEMEVLELLFLYISIEIMKWNGHYGKLLAVLHEVK